MKTKFTLLLLLFLSNIIFSQSVVINEFQSSNNMTIEDEDGDYSDWIELYNISNETFNLTNFSLSDDSSNLTKWIFPAASVSPGGHLVVFASGKDKRDVFHYETLFDWGDDWKYFVGQTEGPPSDWSTLNFDDSNWQTGSSGFGYGDDDDSTNIENPDPFGQQPFSCFIRNTFTIDDVNKITKIFLHIDYDDAFVAYINDVEIARENIGTAGVRPAWNDLAYSDHEAQIYQGGEPDEYLFDNVSSLLQNGENVIAIEVHNVSEFSSDMSLIPFLTIEMNDVPANPNGPSEFLSFPEFNLHTNFKITATGEPLFLTSPDSIIIDSMPPVFISSDISYGRKPDGTNNLFFFNQPTPGEANNTTGFTPNNEEVTFSHEGGFFQNNFQLELSINRVNTSIYYTLDGSEPDENSNLYTEPIAIDSIMVVRARTIGDGMLPSKITTNTYFINKNYSLPVLSLTTDPEYLWSDSLGLYILGPNADTTELPYWGANFWQDWERPAHVEYYDANSNPAFNFNVGIKIFGSWSRLYPQKSFAVYTRDEYQPGKIQYQIFTDKPIYEFNNFIIRNSGQDWGRTFFKDAFVTSIGRELGLDGTAYQPAVTFINGQPWGIYNLREKVNEHFIASNHNVDKDNIDMIERDTTLLHGDFEHYNNFISFVQNNDLSIRENYEHVKTLMNVRNYMDYMLMEIFAANSDWPWNNVKIWREREPHGKWRWILFDTDYAFHGGHLGPGSNMYNELRAQQNHTTFLFFKLLESPVYKNEFINRYADLMNTIFTSNSLMERIAQFQNGIEDAFPFHIDRWENTFNEVWWLGNSIDTMQEWFENISIAVNFAQQRAGYESTNLMNEFELEDNGTINLNINGNGKIKINTIVLDEYPWSGIYFQENAISLTALPEPGYHFERWEGISGNNQLSTVTFNFTDGQNVTAVFEEGAGQTSPVVINEINYNSAPDFDTEDWIEFYNNTSQPIDLSGWKFKDADSLNEFIFPQNTVVQSNSFLVLCNDTADFKEFFPSATNFIGEFDFNLSNGGESIFLLNSNDEIIDSLTYDDEVPWHTEPDGNGPTLSLKDPGLDNSIAENWAVSVNHGTPGEANLITGVREEEEIIPDEFSLSQNYPNPFNPVTTIKFSLPSPLKGEGPGVRSTFVTLKIYDILGREVATLVNEEKQPGVYKVKFDATNLASGIYFYKMEAGDFIQTKKMVLIK